MNAPLRPSPTASSRRVLALTFIREYFDRHGESPSFGEIAAALEADIQTVSRIVRRLDQLGEIVHLPGARRDIRLPDAIDEIATREAILVLRRRGWTVNEDVRAALSSIPARQALAPPVINPQLTSSHGLDDLA